ncbi:MAG: phosphate/phosphite/phosphonate ABC transporter substrate-binding protein [Proteobacteria bacterium]|nr:phosphate/phosphite/phosphonate ABC transporter substrate-binding protein [Pseudomonadota bacterium]
MHCLKCFLSSVLFALACAPALAQDACKSRGDLDLNYCDENKDLVADTPKDAKKLKTPGTLVFTYTPVEDPAVYEKAFKPFTDHLAQCTGKKVVFYQVQSNAAEIEAMRSGRLHVGGFSTGPTAFAVNIAGAVPFAVKGYEKEFQGYNLIVIVKKDSPYQKLSDLKGKKLAHTSPSSNSGHMAPLALFPPEGLTPDKDYKILFSGKHDQSVLGVNSGDYDAAAVASDVFHRMGVRGQIKEENFRVIYRSEKFPTSSFSYAHDLEPAFRDKMLKCFYEYRFTEEMKKAFDGADRFFPITYLKDWAVVRRVAEGSGEAFNRTAYEKETRREEEARKKAAEEKAKK